MFLRGLFISLTLLPLTLWLNQSSLSRQLAEIDRYAWLMVVLMAVSSFFFVASIQLTSVAHTLVIVGATPVFAAMIGLYMLKEAVPWNTWLTIVIVFVGLVFVVYDQQQSTLFGDLLAFIACLLWSMNFVLARRTATRNITFVMMLSGCLMVLLSIPLANLPSVDALQGVIGDLLRALNGIALTLLVNAPRFMPSAEVAVFLPVETVLGTLLVWWLLGEYPGHVSLLAGGVIIVAIMLNSYYQIRRPANG